MNDTVGEGLATHLGKPCPYCHEPMEIGRRRPTRDHLFPARRRNEPGTDTVLITCRLCNEDKRDQTIQQWGQRLTRERDLRAPIVLALIRELKLPTRHNRRGPQFQQRADGQRLPGWRNRGE